VMRDLRIWLMQNRHDTASPNVNGVTAERAMGRTYRLAADLLELTGNSDLDTLIRSRWNGPMLANYQGDKVTGAVGTVLKFGGAYSTDGKTALVTVSHSRPWESAIFARGIYAMARLLL